MPTLVQSAHFQAESNGGNSEVLAFPSNVTAGNLLVVMAHSYNQGIYPTVTDSQGNTYTTQVQDSDADGFIRSNINTATAGSSAANTVTVTVTGGSNDSRIGIVIYEYSGTDGSFLTASNKGNSSTASITSTTFRTSEPIAVFVCQITTTTTGWVAATGFTSQFGATNTTGTNAPTKFDEQVASWGGGATTISTTLGASERWVIIVLGFAVISALFVESGPKRQYRRTGVRRR